MHSSDPKYTIYILIEVGNVAATRKPRASLELICAPGLLTGAENSLLLKIHKDVQFTCAEVAQSIYLLTFILFSIAFAREILKVFWQSDVTQEPLLRAAAITVFNAGNLAVFFCCFVQALVAVYMN